MRRRDLLVALAGAATAWRRSARAQQRAMPLVAYLRPTTSEVHTGAFRRGLRELGDRAPANERARAEQLISEVRSLVKQSPSDAARLRQLTSDLRQIGYGLTSAASAPPPSAGTAGSSDSSRQGGQPGSDDVIDAEFRKAG